MMEFSLGEGGREKSPHRDRRATDSSILSLLSILSASTHAWSESQWHVFEGCCLSSQQHRTPHSVLVPWCGWEITPHLSDLRQYHFIMMIFHGSWG